MRSATASEIAIAFRVPVRYLKKSMWYAFIWLGHYYPLITLELC